MLVTSERPHNVRRYGRDVYYTRQINVDGEPYGNWEGYARDWRGIFGPRILAGELALVQFPAS